MTVNFGEALRNTVRQRVFENSTMLTEVDNESFYNEIASQCIEEIKIYSKDFYTFCVEEARAVSDDLKAAYEFDDKEKASNFLSSKYANIAKPNGGKGVN